MSVGKTPGVNNESLVLDRNLSRSGRAAEKKQLEPPVITDVGSELTSNQAETLAKSLGSKVQDAPRQALSAQGAGLSEDTVRRLLEE